MTDLDDLIFNDSLLVVMELELEQTVKENIVLQIAKESYFENKELMDKLKENGD